MAIYVKSHVTGIVSGVQALKVYHTFSGVSHPYTGLALYAKSHDHRIFPSPSSRVIWKLSSWSAIPFQLASISGVHTALKLSPVVTGVSSVHRASASISRRPLRL